VNYLPGLALNYDPPALRISEVNHLHLAHPNSFSYFLSFLLYYCYTGGTQWHLQKFLQYIIVEVTPSIILFYPISPIPVIVSTCLIFPFSYMSTYFHHIQPPSHFPYIPHFIPILYGKIIHSSGFSLYHYLLPECGEHKKNLQVTLVVLPLNLWYEPQVHPTMSRGNHALFPNPWHRLELDEIY
jgi:hypothetical protein